MLTPDQVTLFGRLIEGKSPTDLIFTAPEGSAWHSGVFHAHRWKLALAAANAAGLAKRLALPVIQPRLGHESITTTVDRYGHLLASSDDEVVAAVEWAMAGTTPQGVAEAA